MRGAAIFVVLAGCAARPPARSATAAPDRPAPRELVDLVGRPAPRFSLPSARDGEAAIAVPTNEVTVVTFFGTWSMGWQFALPALEELRKKFPAIRVVAVSMDEDRPTDVAERYAPLPIAWSGGMGTKTNADWLSGPYGGENRVFVLDRKGTIRFVHRGGKDSTVFRTPEGQREVEDEVAALLAER